MSALFFAYVMFSAELTSECIAGRYEQYSADAPKQYPEYLRRVLFVPSEFRWWAIQCPARFMLKYGSAIAAVATVVYVFFAFLLWHSTRNLWLASAKQSAEFHKDYVARYRPKIRVRKFSVEPFSDGEPMVVRYQIVNIGGTSADILRNMLTVCITSAGDIGSTRDIPPHGKIRAGEALTGGGAVGVVYDKRWGTPELLVSGEIHYVDENGITRRTGFQRKGVGKRFPPLNSDNNHDPDNNFED